jgi:hypothetical protein
MRTAKFSWHDKKMSYLAPSKLEEQVESSLKALESVDDEFPTVVAGNHDSDLGHEKQAQKNQKNEWKCSMSSG